MENGRKQQTERNKINPPPIMGRRRITPAQTLNHNRQIKNFSHLIIYTHVHFEWRNYTLFSTTTTLEHRITECLPTKDCRVGLTLPYNLCEILSAAQRDEPDPQSRYVTRYYNR